MKAAIGTISALLSMFAVLRYSAAASASRGRASSAPRVSTWAVWTLQSVVNLAVTLAAGQRTGAPLLGAYLVSNVIGLGAAVRCGGVRSLGRLDLVCGAAGLCGVIVWTAVGDPRATVILEIGGSAIASVPTLLNALAGREPSSAWLMWAVAADLNLRALDSHGLQARGLPIYFAILTTSIWTGCLVATVAVSRRVSRMSRADRDVEWER
jgi:hypothetical protein